jgi:thiamine biosynthesis lipoprotein
MKKTVTIALVCGILLSGCGLSGERNAAASGDGAPGIASIQVYENTGFVMGTVVSTTVYTTGGDISEELVSALSELETRYISCKLSGTELTAINENAAAGKPTEVSDKTREYLISALSIASNSGGAFDPTIGRLSALWDFDSGNNIVPAKEDIAALLKDVGYSRLAVQGNRVEVGDGIMVDLGAIGKGIACDEALSFLSGDAAVTGALMNLGGSSTVTYGEKKSGEPWKVAILDPRDDTGFLGVLSLDGTNHISTSADYEKYFIKDGKRYHHILDPFTGYPADSGLISVTVVADGGAVSDGLSTACFVLGREKAIELLKDYGVEAILVDENKDVYVTEGLRDRFEFKAEGYGLAAD